MQRLFVFVLIGTASFTIFSADLGTIADVLPFIIAFPDVPKLNELVEIQRVKNRSDKESGEVNKYLQIRNALFPNRALLLTCKYFSQRNDNKFKEAVNAQACINLQLIMPQGMLLHLLPETIKLNFYKEYIIPNQNNFDVLLRLCISKNLVPAESFSHALIENHSLINALPLQELSRKKQSRNVTNSIFYLYTEKKEIKSYTLLEYVLKMLEDQLNFYRNCPLSHTNNRDELLQQEIWDNFKNFFTLIDYLCSLKDTDLTLPAMCGNYSIASVLSKKFGACYSFNTVYRFPFAFLSSFVQERISNDKGKTSAPLQEDPVIIKQVVETFL